MPTIKKTTAAVFTPGEAERITHVSTATQRDWRRHKHLRVKREGWTHFEPLDLAQMMVMKLLQDKGMGPSITKEIVNAAAVRILHFALNSQDTSEDRAAAKAMRRFMIAWPNSKDSYTDDLNSAFGGPVGDPKYLGAAIVMDLAALGGLLASRAGRPLSVET